MATDLVQELEISNDQSVPNYSPELITDSYTINYAAGEVTFASTQTGTITANYHYATTSDFILKPKEGHVLYIEHAEVQFSIGGHLNDSLLFEIWAGGPYGYAAMEGYSDAQYDAGFGQRRIYYRSIVDFINYGNEGIGKITKTCDNSEHSIMNGGNCITQDVAIFPFKYISVIGLKYSDAALLRIKLRNDIPVSDGEIATCTFYLECESE